MGRPYPKIETAFERDPDTHKVDATKPRSPYVFAVAAWSVTEKLDGTNIRISIRPDGSSTFGGRTDKAQLYAPLVQNLEEVFHTPDMVARIHRQFPYLTTSDDPPSVTLYGEGVGAGIQKGGGDYGEPHFVLFDVKIGDGLVGWLDDGQVRDVATGLDICTVPNLALQARITDVINGTARGFPSEYAVKRTGKERPAEGVICRPACGPLYDRRGHRVILKLKTHDFPERAQSGRVRLNPTSLDLLDQRI